MLEIEKRVGKAGQGILEFVHVKDGDRNELTEVEVGWKQALLWSETHVLSGAAILAIPTNSDDGELQTYLAYGRELNPDWTFQGSLRMTFPLDGAGDGRVELAGIVHYVHSPWPVALNLGVEIPVTGQPWDESVHVTLLWDFADGGFFKGW